MLCVVWLCVFNIYFCCLIHTAGYFDSMYRSAIVGRHLVDIDSPTVDKEATHSKCIDIYQFLLEALPASISELHILILYGRTLETHSQAGMRFRANAVYAALFDYCHQNDIANASNFMATRVREHLADYQHAYVFVFMLWLCWLGMD
jgi:hypothetical protein